jgi:hypothetical protein
VTIYRFPVSWTECLLFLLLAVWLARPLFLGAQVQVREATQVQEIHVEFVVSLGDEDGPGTVGRPAAVERRSNGEWVLTDAHNPEFVKFFTSEGTWLRTLGRRGDGPGEFRQAWFLQMLPEDSLAVFDYGSGRLTVFTPDLQVARITPLRVPVTREEDTNDPVGGGVTAAGVGGFDREAGPSLSAGTRMSMVCPLPVR